jgi:acetyl-CoA carboxylase biotin carboxyl carrier protein
MNLEEIKELIRVFGRSKLGKLKLKDGEFEVSMTKEGSEVAVVSAPAQAAPAAAATVPQAAAPAASESVSSDTQSAELSGDIITSPMVGTFYASPSPDSPPFVKAGDSVRKGQTLCILEAMKIMNELEAEYDCKILEVLVQDGEPIEYDTPLFRVEKL